MNILRNCLFITALVLQVLSSFGLYDGTNDVKVFDSKKDFRESVLESDQIWLVQFYAPWCGHCKQFVPVYGQIATLLKGIVPFAAVDAATDGPQKRIAADYGVGSFPTMKIFGADKKNPIDVKNRDPNGLIQELLQVIQDTIQVRGDKIKGGSDSSSKSSRSKKSASKVVQLTSSNFSEKVYNNDEVMLVAFAAPWCGHCKQLLPEWEEAATKLDGTGASLGWVDATADESLAQQFKVQGFPTIKVFPGGKGKSSYSAVDYQGGRDASQIVQAALEEVDRSGVPKEIPELVNEDVMKEHCEGSGSKICVFFALPHILDTGADGRNKYKEVMSSASKAVRGMAFNFLWFEGGSQYELENSLELTFGFPAVAAYSVDKGVYTVHRGSFTESNIRKFLTGITTGKQGTYKIQKVPTINTVEPWDGKDGVPFEEESLEDIMGWDDDDDNVEENVEEPEL